MMWERVLTSIEVAQLARAARETAGTQPHLPFSTPWHVAGANMAYVVVTLVLYQVMRRGPEGVALPGVRPVMAVYNLVCVALAATVVYGVVSHKLVYPGSFVCNADAGTTPADHRLAWYFWLFYVQKYWEYADTLFFLLRRSFRQVSFLHVYHHASIAVVVGLIIPYAYAGDVYLPIILNACVHVLMYAHYFVTSLGWRGAWWAPYLTGLQLVQFVLIAAQALYAYAAGPRCGYPDFAKVLVLFYMASMLALFSHFFVRKYLGSKPKPKPKAA
jgi:elongation of very long chain fatty acids protein 4